MGDAVRTGLGRELAYGLGVSEVWDGMVTFHSLLHLQHADGHDVVRHDVDRRDLFVLRQALGPWAHLRHMLSPDQRDQIEAIVRLLLVGAIWGVMALGYLALMKLDGNC